MATLLVSPADVASLPANECEASGLVVVPWPELKVAAPRNYSELDEAIDNLFGYDWLVLKNQNAADSFLARFHQRFEAAQLDDLKTIAIGEAAGEILVRAQIHVDVTIDGFPSQNIFTVIERYAGDLKGLTFLLPSAGLKTELFEQKLRDAGARVDNVTAFQTSPETRRLAQILALIAGGGIDAVGFASLSALDEFARLFDTDDLAGILTGLTIICGDADSAQAAAARGLSAIKLMSGPLSASTLAKLLNTSP
jgi:uroporphyrinogen III methyltransferase/synthase